MLQFTRDPRKPAQHIDSIGQMACASLRLSYLWRPVGSANGGVHRPPRGGQPGRLGGHGRSPLCARPGRRHPPDSALQAWVQQDRSSWSRSGEWWPRSGPTACRRAWTACSPTWTTAWCWRPRPSPRPRPSTASRPRSSPGRSVWATPPIFVAPLYDGALEGLTALYAAERAYLDTGRPWPSAARPTRPTMPGSRTGAGRRSAPLSAPSAGPGRARGTPSPVLTGRLGVLFTGAARFELAFWEMCWSGQGMAGLSQHLFTLGRPNLERQLAHPTVQDRQRRPGP